MIRRNWSLIVVVAVAGATAGGCDLPGKPRPAPGGALDFSALYGRNCAGCHGANGGLGPAPPLNNALFLQIVPDSELSRVITEGRPGTPMPAFARSRGGPLTEAEVEVLAQGIKPRWSVPQKSAVPDPPPYESTPSASPDQAKQGMAVFARACAGCHGEEGEGGDQAGALHDRSLLALISNQLLRRYIITGRPDLGMPDFTGRDGRDDSFRRLSSAEIDALVGMLGRWRDGKTEPPAVTARQMSP